MSGGRCTQSVYGIHGRADVHGCCPWCGRKVEAKARRPYHTAAERDAAAECGYNPDDHTDVAEAYRYMYEPDWGSDR